jgi:ubiquinone/menaquinone biosynthesis C-methylase UbiE
MPVINRRNRLVNFRLSDQELEELRRVCHKGGARSISDFARLAVLRAIENCERPEAAQINRGRVEDVARRTEELEIRMSLILQLLELRDAARNSPRPKQLAQTA